jgi:flagellar hook-associated protein 3 FlgL
MTVGRVTQNMISTQLMRNMYFNTRKLDHYLNQLATGRKINKPSDDPVGISFSMRYRSELSAGEQHAKNVDSALSWLDFTDTILDQFGTILQRARQLAVQGANDSNPNTALDSIASEIDQLFEQLINVGNSNFNGKYIFNGEMTDIAPYSDTAPMNDDTDTGAIRYEIGVGVLIQINITGNDVFGSSAETDNAFRVLSQLSNALRAGDTAQVSQLIGAIDTRMDKLLEQRANLGAKYNRLELAANRLSDTEINVQKLLAKSEDADMAEVITLLKMQENVYQASLAAGARLITPSLVNFLK